jgi:hypothetical protein
MGYNPWYFSLRLSAGVQTVRAELQDPRSACDKMWDLLESGVRDEKLIGCGRFVPDPYAENASFRYGISLGNSWELQ